MNTRLTVTAATATVLASVALYPLMTAPSWFWAGVGAVIVAAAVGALTRLRPVPAVVCFLACAGRAGPLPQCRCSPGRSRSAGWYRPGPRFTI